MSEQRRHSSIRVNDSKDTKFSIDVSNVHTNTTQEVIVTTNDKVELCLRKHVHRIDKRLNWMAPLGFLLSIVITLKTSTFKDDFLLEAAVWKAIFIVFGIISISWLLYCIYQAFTSITIEELVEEIKKGSKNIDANGNGTSVH